MVLGGPAILDTCILEILNRDGVLKKALYHPFRGYAQWVAELKMRWKFLDAEKKRYRVEIVSYCPKSVFYGILRFLETGEDNALPSYLLIIDFYEDNQLYALKGELCWTRKPVNLERIRKYIADDQDALFGKPLDLVNGSFDW